MRKRAEVRERRVRRPARGCKESFATGKHILLQDHVSKKWNIPGEITNVRLAPDNKILSYEIRTDNGNLTTRHRPFIKKIPQINNEANVPVIVDDPSAPSDDTKIPEPAETWTRGGRLRAKLSTIHTLESNDPISKISSPDGSNSALEYISSWINISNMKEVDSEPSNHTATTAAAPSRPGRESPYCQAATIATISSRPDPTPTEQGEEAQAAQTDRSTSQPRRGVLSPPITVHGKVFTRDHWEKLGSQAGGIIVLGSLKIRSTLHAEKTPAYISQCQRQAVRCCAS